MDFPNHIRTKSYQLEIRSNYLISTFFEGITLDKEHVDQILEICIRYYGDRPYGYISNRIYDYGVNPLAFTNYPSSTGAKVVAVVCPTNAKKRTAEFERKFITAEHIICHTLEEAIQIMENRFQTSEVS